MILQTDFIFYLFIIAFLLTIGSIYLLWRKQNQQAPWFFSLIMLLLFGAGLWAANWQGRIKNQEIRNQLLRQAEAIARTINPEQVKSLNFTSTDKTKPEFQQLCGQMKAYKNTIREYFRVPNLSIYSMATHDGKIVFGPESIEEHESYASTPGTVYKLPSVAVKNIFSDGHAFTEGPYTDEYGTFVSAYAAVFDPGTGKVLLVIGMDIEFAFFQKTISGQRLITFLCVLLLVFVLLGGNTLLALRKHDIRERYFLFKYAEAVIVATFGVVLTIIIAMALHNNEMEKQREMLTQVSEPEAKSVCKAFRNFRDYQVGGLVRYFSGSRDISREEFHTILSPMFRMSGRQTIIGWAVPVPEQKKAVWESTAHMEGMANFRIWQKDRSGIKIPAENRKSYFPFWYVEPFSGNEMLMGYDLGSGLSGREALEKAMKTGLPAASDPVFLSSSLEENSEILIFHPVFTGENENRTIHGFIVALLNLKLFLQKAVSSDPSEKPQTIIDLYQLESNQFNAYLVSTSKGEQPHKAKEPDDLNTQLHNNMTAIYPVFIFGKSYAVVISPLPDSIAAASVYSGYLALMIGLLLTVLFAAFTVFLNQRQAYLKLQVEARTFELRMSEEEVKRKNEALEKSNSEKDKYFSIIAHDLRGPFNSLLGYTEIMTEELQTMTMEEIEQIAGHLRKSAINLYNLLENLLEWSQLQRGIIHYIPESFLLSSNISDSLNIILDSAAKKGIAVNIDIQNDLEIYADRHMFESVIRNLTFNAVKFTPKGGDIAVMVKKTENEMIEVSIRDSGIGMSEQLISKLFLLSEQTNRPGTNGEPSTGLGLIICKDFIEKHGGQILVESEVGKGSTFFVRFPEKRNFYN
ncbi:MAG: CHASE domain-containing protein [Bacteroidota bacterium]